MMEGDGKWFEYPKVSFPQPLSVSANAASACSVVESRLRLRIGDKCKSYFLVSPKRVRPQSVGLNGEMEV